MKAVPPFLSKLPLLFFFLISLNYPPESYAQSNRCGTVPFDQVPSSARFEQWLQQKISRKQARTTVDGPIYRIPVVVHVVHRGEPLGEGANIPFEQIADQIRILNEDFRRQNPDTVNTREIFRPVAADTRIEFELARRDPNGLPTNGVVRVEADRNNYGLSDASLLSALSQWDPDQYMNLWVAPIQGGLLGFVPIRSLVSLEDPMEIPFVDGVIINYLNFGSIGNIQERYDGGRTATHEVGHYLGLRHVWGDGDCDADDFVQDTPRQADSYDGCPVDAATCGSPDMYDNYMDLTDDACMNIFTEDQALRMRTVLESSPQRNSLLFSPALEAPVLVANDASITRIVAPQTSECDVTLVPRVSVLNAGTNVINTLTAEFSVEGNLIEETTFNLNLPPGQSREIMFSSLDQDVALDRGVLYEASFEITEVNNTVDNNARGNSQSVTFLVPQEDELPLIEDFQFENDETFFDKSVVLNPDDQITWARDTAATTSNPNNRALFINFFDYEDLLGERDFLYSPTLDLSNLPASALSFRVAYAPYVGDDSSLVSQDGLLVGVSTDCGATISEIVYEKFGEELATQPARTAPFSPTSDEDWRAEVISLNDYLDEPNVQLVFIGVNDFGNNLYLDDIELFVTEYDSLQPSENSFSIEPNPVVNQQLEVEFNLLSVDDIAVAVYNTRGALVGEYTFPNTLNQTYTISMAGQPAGVYILRALGRTIEEGQQFILQ